MYENALFHAAQATRKCLEGLGYKDQTPNSLALYPIEKLLAIEQRGYANGEHFSTLNELWKAIEPESAAIPRSIVNKLNDSVNDRLFNVIRCHGAFISK